MHPPCDTIVHPTGGPKGGLFSKLQRLIAIGCAEVRVVGVESARVAIAARTVRGTDMLGLTMGGGAATVRRGARFADFSCNRPRKQRVNRLRTPALDPLAGYPYRRRPRHAFLCGSRDDAHSTEASLCPLLAMRRSASPREAPSRSITDHLRAWNDGDRGALDALIPMVYEELLRIARRTLRRETPGHTLQTAALVHEAYMRLAKQRHGPPASRVALYGVAARGMRG